MRLVVFLSVPFVLLLSVLLLFGADSRTPTVQAQAVDGANARQLFLPYIATGAAPIKRKSGIHLGNRGTDWQDEFLARLRGTKEGDWPAATVVLSNQLYTIKRARNFPCRVDDVDIRAKVLYQYLSDAIHAGTIIIIRIYPSPGNFADYDHPGKNHRLLSSITPAGTDYCSDDQSQQSEKYRDILDIVYEMRAIYRMNVEEYNWPSDRFYFEPANEPNNEWYVDIQNQIIAKHPLTTTRIIPNSDNKDAWLAMDEYFSNLFALVKEEVPSPQVLTPPMSQGNFGEHLIIGGCQTNFVHDEGNLNPSKSGYDWMIKTYNSPDVAGYSWHNYWKWQHEAWEQVGFVEWECDKENYTPQSHHVVQYFPVWLQMALHDTDKPKFITEADLHSPCKQVDQPVYSKKALPDLSVSSLSRFFTQEGSADYVIAWLLVQEYIGSNCDGNAEIAWHEAYEESGFEWAWFQKWWTSVAQ